MGPLNKNKEGENMCESCNRIRTLDVDGTIYNYYISNSDPGCIESWCQTRRAIIEIAPRRYAKLHSSTEITEKDIENEIKRQKRKEV
jgi:hypothetical protein